MEAPGIHSDAIWALKEKRQAEADCLRASATEMLAYIIADRDCFYEGCTDLAGNCHDEYDKRELARVDAIIERAREALGHV